MRKFEIVDRHFIKDNGADSEIYLPKRATPGSAGYDFKAPYDIDIYPTDVVKFYTNIKVKMPQDEVLKIYIRSSLAIKKRLTLPNFVGIIDSDYYSNPDNDGNIIIAFINNGFDVVEIKKGDKIAQGIFEKYHITDDDCPVSDKRTGGIGSTN